MAFYIGLDVGGTKLSGVLVDGSLTIKRKLLMALPVKKKKSDLLQSIFSCIEELKDGREANGIGVGIAGVISKGAVIKSPHLKAMNGVDLMSELERRFKTKAAVDNDVNCLALYAAGKSKKKNILTLTIGTGIGAGIVIDGKVYRGAGFAGEVGHMSIKFDGRRCACGNHGCFEEYVSGRGLEALSEEMLGQRVEPERLAWMAKEGDRKAMGVWKRFGELLGTGLANLTFLLHPDEIALGGGIAQSGDLFISHTRKELKRRLFYRPPKISLLEEEGNALGAALLVKQTY